MDKYQIEISSMLPACPHWTYTLLKVGGKGCSHIRKLCSPPQEINYNNWPHLTNSSEFLRELGVHFLPNEAAKVISSIYKTSTVPLARDIQISILRNNLYAKELLHKMKVIQDPSCPFCPNVIETRIHRFWDCPQSKMIWQFVNKVLDTSCMKPIFKQEAMLGLYEESSTSNNNLIILYSKWYLDQAKREASPPSLASFASALQNALSAQFEFMEAKYTTEAKTKIINEIETLKFFLENLNSMGMNII